MAKTFSFPSINLVLHSSTVVGGTWELLTSASMCSVPMVSHHLALLQWCTLCPVCGEHPVYCVFNTLYSVVCPGRVVSRYWAPPPWLQPPHGAGDRCLIGTPDCTSLQSLQRVFLFSPIICFTNKCCFSPELKSCIWLSERMWGRGVQTD